MTAILPMSLFAADPVTKLVDNASQGSTVNAVMGEFFNVSLDILPDNGGQGSPFDLMKSDVWPRTADPSGTTGRIIAKWSVMTNVGARSLSITATPLKLMEKGSNGAYSAVTNGAEINYRLAFELYGYKTAQGTMVTDYLYVYSGVASVTNAGTSTNEGKIDNWISANDGMINMPYISSGRPVHILLMDNDGQGSGVLYTAQERENWPSGFYQATITINISGGL